MEGEQGRQDLFPLEGESGIPGGDRIICWVMYEAMSGRTW